MRYIKKYNESIYIKDFQKEIEDLNYILEDEGVQCDMEFYTSTTPYKGDYLVIYPAFQELSKVVNSNSSTIGDRVKCWRECITKDYFIEYLERINEICKKNGYSIIIQDTQAKLTICDLKRQFWVVLLDDSESRVVKYQAGNVKMTEYTADDFLKDL